MKGRLGALLTTAAIGMLAIGLGFASTAVADEYADAVAADGINNASCGGNCDGSANDTLGAPDGAYASLGTDGFVTVNFTDNVCFVRTGEDDVTVTEIGAAEDYTVAIGLMGGTLSAGVLGNGTDDIDLSTTSVAVFNQAKITDGGAAPGSTFSGADIDAIECLSTLDQADIVKDFAINPLDGDAEDEIFVREKGDFTVQHKAFTIEITNNTGVNGGLAGLTFFDAVPAEYDLDPAGEDWGDTTLNSCAETDNTCDGIFVVGDCTVTATRTHGSTRGKNGGNKLEPELLSIDASGVLDGDDCSIIVFVVTEDGHKKSATPTSCPVNLNSGVKVFDATMNLLLQDDDKLIFDNGEGTDGTCNDA